MEETLLRFSNLSGFSNVVHGVAPRALRVHGRFNMSFEFGPREEVAANRDRLLEMAGGGMERLISARQTHSDHVYVHRLGDSLPEPELDDFDAFVSEVPGVAFLVKTADCQPVLMVDPVRNVVGLAHSGWRGSLKNVIGKTVRAMEREFGAQPADVRVGVGPSLGPCCAEFSNLFAEVTVEALRFGVEGSLEEDGRGRIDFWRMTRDQLLNEGVLEEHMEFANECTVCSRDRWFSYRGDTPDEGRFGTIIGLRNRENF